jgi:hypothetical protein
MEAGEGSVRITALSPRKIPRGLHLRKNSDEAIPLHGHNRRLSADEGASPTNSPKSSRKASTEKSNGRKGSDDEGVVLEQLQSKMNELVENLAKASNDVLTSKLREKTLEDEIVKLKADLIKFEQRSAEEKSLLVQKTEHARISNRKLLTLVESLSQSKSIADKVSSDLGEYLGKDGQGDEILSEKIATLERDLKAANDTIVSLNKLQSSLIQTSSGDLSRPIGTAASNFAIEVEKNAFLFRIQLYLWIVILFVMLILVVHRPNAYTGYPSSPTPSFEDIVDSLKRRLGF